MGLESRLLRLALGGMPVRTLTNEIFNADLKRGQELEDYIEEYFKGRGWSVKRARGNIPAYDAILTKEATSIAVEIKHDILSDSTGNYALEGKSLQQTQSDILIIGTVRECYALPISTAKKLYNAFPKKQTGDQLYNISALVPKQVFIDNHFQRL
jgi:hypothetical protein